MKDRPLDSESERDPSGSRISVVLSCGQEKVKVPDVSGLNSSQTAEVLINAGLCPDYEVSFD